MRCLMSIALVLSLGGSAPADTAADARASIDKGVEFLKKQQQPDGGWQTSPRDPPGITGLVVRALVQHSETGLKSDVVQKGYKNLLSNQKPDGGIYADMLANYNTAIAISSLAAAQNPEFKDEIDKAVAFLKGVQVKGADSDPSVGGASYGAMKPGGKPPRADLSNTQMFIEALKDAGLNENDPAFKDAIKFVSRTQNRSESNDQKWAGEDGGFIYTPADGGSSNAGEYTGPDGRKLLRSYGLMTYAGLKSMIYAGLTKEDPRVKAAWDWITKNWTLDENPGMKFAGPEKATAGMYYYYHTLATALAAHDEPVITDPKGNKHDWRVEFVAKVKSLQKPDGSWVGDKQWMENNPILATTFAVLALQAVEKDLKEHPAK